MKNPIEYEARLETIEILSDKDAAKRIRLAKLQIKRGQTVSLEALRKAIEQS